MTRVQPCLALAWLFAAAAPLRAQDDAAPLARAFVQAQAPASDDPDRVARDLVTAALQHPRSPIAGFLVAEAGRLVGSLQDPGALATLLSGSDEPRRHGLCAQELAILRWRLARAMGQAPGRFPTFGHARELLACGPFGDAGDAFVGVALAPELDFPTAGSELPGRFGKATCQVATGRGDNRAIDLATPPRWAQGCHYGRWCVIAEAEADGFLEIEHDGDQQVFVDGVEVLRLERWQRTASFRQFVGVRLPAGGHEVVVKAATNGRTWVAMRFVDAEGHALAGVRPHGTGALPPGARATRTEATFVTGETMLARLAAAAGASDELRIAAVLAALREGNGDRALDLAGPLRATPPAAGATALAWARVLRQLALPDERKKAEARKLEEGAIAGLPPDHHTARLAQAALQEEQDRREDALLLLAAHPAPGPETFARRCDLLRTLKFSGQLTATLRAWTVACPRDSRPWAQLATEAQATRATALLFELRQKSLALRPDQAALAQTTFRDALALRRFDDAAKLLDLAAPEFGDPLGLPRARLELELARARGDQAGIAVARERIAQHPAADGDVLRDLAAQWHADGNAASARAAVDEIGERGLGKPADAAFSQALGGSPPPIAELLACRHDGKALAAAFTAGERERGASTTLLVDQKIVVLAADGGATIETHQLRRINDQAGVEGFGEKLGLGRVDEVLLVRTLATDGSEAIPSRVDGDYSLQKLEPGAFVEWRYREHLATPNAGELAHEPFVFGSESEPTALAEFVVVLPTGRGELRTRGLGEPTRTDKLADGRTVATFARRDLPALPKEQFLPSLLDLLPVAEVGEDSQPWPELRNQRVQLGRRTRLVQDLRDAAMEAVGTATAPRAQAEAIWAYCQEQVEDGNADSALETLLRKKGSRFLLAVALLRAAGLQVVPFGCPAEATELGGGTSSLFADVAAVHLPGAALLLPDGTRLAMFVDTPRHWPLGQVPASRSRQKAVLAFDDRFEPWVLPASAGHAQGITVRGTATLRGKDLVLAATAELGDVPGFALAERFRQMKESIQKQAARQIAQQLFAGFRVEEARIDTPKGSPLRIVATVKRSGVQRNGDRHVVPLPLPQQKYVSTFGDRAERTMPWHLPTDLATDWSIEFDPGADLRLVQVPASVSLSFAPLQFDQRLTVQDGKVRCERTVHIGAATRPASVFGDWLRTLGAADRAEAATMELLDRAK
ncbi:MAG: hypothetical protein JNK15_15035 [Planctomycetes bacterium]|nr:hypothetical protein [Planctomycetota bacterium]